MQTAVSTYNQTDPTRTLTLRRRFAAAHTKRFRELRGIILDAIVNKDVFGIAGGHDGLQSNMGLVVNANANVPPNAFDFPLVQGKVTSFMEWLEEQVDKNILEVSDRRQIGAAINDAWGNVFIEDTYKRGVIRAAYEMENVGYSVSGQNVKNSIEVVMSAPPHVDRLGVLYTRAFNELKGITDTMGQQISRVLAQGLADGDGPRLLARKLNKTISGKGGDLGLTDTLGRYIPAERRAQLLARTETIRAHHQGMMQTYRNWGAEGVAIQAEFRTAGDGRVCAQCDGLNGQVFSLQDAENLIPVHPQCRCIALPTEPEIKSQDNA